MPPKKKKYTKNRVYGFILSTEHIYSQRSTHSHPHTGFETSSSENTEARFEGISCQFFWRGTRKWIFPLAKLFFVSLLQCKNMKTVLYSLFYCCIGHFKDNLYFYFFLVKREVERRTTDTLLQIFCLKKCNGKNTAHALSLFAVQTPNEK